ncbi:MAG: IS66 family transposase zinc-finger binding domain-containing protein, partial [Accumulibacter sp.]|uniref:IS66 family transposase zinc-finger binding domain-containing protein n=1 Tax=Accumulibacter sp. TaxID=2053492 RepID=UPI0033160977
MVDLERESRLEVLRRAALTQDAEIRRLLQVNEQMRETIVRLEAQLADKKADDPAVVAELQRIREILAQREKVLFGPSSERRPAITPKAEPKPKAEAKPKGHGPTPQPALPNVTVTHELDASQQLCTVCDGQLIEWAGQEEISEEIDVVDVQYILKKHVRRKYRCRCECTIE